jgi:Fe(3+) dicitrate transport protein
MFSLLILLALTQSDGGVPETTVKARRNDVRWVAGSAQIISNEELERHESNDLHRVLDGVPGVYVREEDGFGLRPNIGLRGVSSDRSSKVTLMEDGVLFGPAPYSAPAAYYTPLITRMVAVEVFKGPSAIRFGPQTIGGALNFKTRDVPEQTLGDVDISVGSFGSLKLHGVAGTGDDTFGVLVEGVHLQSQGFKVLDTLGNTGFDKNELMTKARFQFGAVAKQSLELKLGFSNETSNESYVGLTREDFADSPYRRYGVSAGDQMNWWRTQGTLKHQLKFKKFDLETTLYRHDFDRTWNRLDSFANGPGLDEVLRNPAGRNALFAGLLNGSESSTSADEQLVVAHNHRTFVSQGIASVAHLSVKTLALEHEFEMGLRIHHDEIERDHVGEQFAVLAGSLGSTVKQFPLVRNNAFTRSLAFHVLDAISWGPLLVAPGLRIEAADSTMVDRLSASTSEQTTLVPLLGLGALYAFEFGGTVFAGVHQGFSALAPGQPPDTKPETALNSELGLRFARFGLKAEVTGFWSEYQNITSECTASSGCVGDGLNQQFNGGAARTLGLEMALSARRKFGRSFSLALDASFTLTNSNFLSSFRSLNPSWGNVRAGDAVPYVPAGQGTLRLRGNVGIFELSTGAHYVSELREQAGQGETDLKVPARWVLDADASAAVGAGRFYVNATNILNQAALVATRPFGARPQAPFMLQVGFKYLFR